MDKSKNLYREKYKKYIRKYYQNGGSILTHYRTPEMEHRVHVYHIPQINANEIIRSEFMTKTPKETTKFDYSAEGIISNVTIDFVKKSVHLARSSTPLIESYDAVLAAHGGNVELLNLNAIRYSGKLSNDLFIMLTKLSHKAIIKWFGGSYTRANIIDIHDQASYDFYMKNNYVVMEKMDCDLHHFLLPKPSWSPDFIMNKTAHIFSNFKQFMGFILICMNVVYETGLYLVDNGYINTDLKPGNVFVKVDNKNGKIDVKLADIEFCPLFDFPKEYLKRNYMRSKYGLGDEIRMATFYNPKIEPSVSTEAGGGEGPSYSVYYKEGDTNETTIKKLESQQYYSILLFICSLFSNIGVLKRVLHFKLKKYSNIVFSQDEATTITLIKCLKKICGIFVNDAVNIMDLVADCGGIDMDGDNFLRRDDFIQIFSSMRKLVACFVIETPETLDAALDRNSEELLNIEFIKNRTTNIVAAMDSISEPVSAVAAADD